MRTFSIASIASLASIASIAPLASIASIIALTTCACSTTAPPPDSASLQLKSVTFQGTTIPYALFVPAAQEGALLPVLLLLHGGGGNGVSMEAIWEPLARQEGVVLVAPTLSLSAAQETQVRALLPAILDDATAGLAVDARRTYAFGYSAGGYFAFDAGTLVADRFAAAAIFAAFIAPGYEWIVAAAPRKAPLALYIGDRDQFFTLAQTRGTRDLLQRSGYQVHYVELPGRDHAWGSASDPINRDAWEFLRAARLP
jgi:poly(3-hydroxybutyrate) depolymerase